MKTFATDSCQWDTYGPGLKLEKKMKPELLIIILLKYCFSVFPHYDTVKFSESYNSIIITEMRLNLPNQGKPSASVTQQSYTGISELKQTTLPRIWLKVQGGKRMQLCTQRSLKAEER